MADSWQEYQEEAAVFFRSLGLDASTNVPVKGARTSHAVDVLVKSTHVGFQVTWIVECKHWKTPVSKLHVLALREIVADVGADRGILLCETGFQSGAIEAAQLTNVQMTSLALATDSARSDIYAMRLRDLYDRIENCNDRYWDIPKRQRIESGLRGDVGELAYSGARAIELARDLLSRALRGIYPFKSEALAALIQSDLPEQFHSAQEVFTVVEPIVDDLERRLNTFRATNQRAYD
jgi:restriction system protein